LNKYIITRFGESYKNIVNISPLSNRKGKNAEPREKLGQWSVRVAGRTNILWRIDYCLGHSFQTGC